MHNEIKWVPLNLKTSLLNSRLFRNMKPRYKFVNDPFIFMESGHRLPDEMTPSIMSCRTLFCKILNELFVAVNPIDEHLCTKRCYDELQVIIGKPNELATNLVPRK